MSIEAPYGERPNPENGAVTNRMSSPRRPAMPMSFERISPTSRPRSTVVLLVAASMNCANVAGLVMVSRLVALSINALRKACWRRPRLMSPWLRS